MTQILNFNSIRIRVTVKICQSINIAHKKLILKLKLGMDGGIRPLITTETRQND